MDTGSIEPWCAVNFGDSSLAPSRTYLLPDEDEDDRIKSLGARRTAFYADLKSARDGGFEVTQPFVEGLAKQYGVTAPALAPPPAPATAAPAPPVTPPSPDLATAPAAPALLRLVPPIPEADDEEPSAPARELAPHEQAEHASRMMLALLADIREANLSGVRVTQQWLDELAKKYGVPAPLVKEG